MRSNAISQESNSLYHKILHFPDKLFNQVEDKTADIQDRLVKQTEKYLQRLSREEERLRKRVAKKDSAAAIAIFGDAATEYANLQNQIKSPPSKVEKFRNKYIPHLDTLQTAFRFLQQTNGLLDNTSRIEDLKNVLGKMGALQGKFNQTEEIKKYLKQRKAFLQDQLSHYGLAKELKTFKKEVYYYHAQIEEYKAMFDNPARLEAKAIEVLSNTPLFKKFFANNSQLAGIFRLPGSSSYDMPTASLAGLQAGNAVRQEIRQRFGRNVNVNRFAQQQAHNTQSPLSTLKNKLHQFGNGSIGNGNIDIDMPDFKPNSQKVKRFKDRLEVGTNLQTVKSNGFFPTTSDIGISLGYKLNDNGILGIGSSYKLGLGKDIRHISISHQGVGLRSFLDYRIKGNFFLSGGYEQNFRATFQRIEQLKNMNAWQTSGLIGLSKRYSISNKLKGNMQLLWDFLSYQQVPRTQAIILRLGYALK
jgi:hypothetical protein